MPNFLVPFESFAAKDSDGELAGLMLSVPHNCGLAQADSLRISGQTLLAVRNHSVLPLDFAKLTHEARADLFSLAVTGQRVAVAEFTAIGLVNAYFLKLIVARDS